MAPGHEIAGVVRAVGANVTSVAVGDAVAVGCHVYSCRSCVECAAGRENHCLRGVQTYSSPFPAGAGHDDCAGYHTNGGYSSDIVVDSHFVYKAPANLPLAAVGPLMCAGVTTFAPLARHVLGKANQRVGVVGLGGLGHMAVKIAKAMGAEVVVFSRSTAKAAAAAHLGASLVATSDAAAMGAAARSLDVVVDTVSGEHDVNALLHTLKVGGKLVMVGAEPKPHAISGFALIMARVGLEGSLTGGVPETQAMLDFCAAHNIVPDYDVITAAETPAAFLRLKSNDMGAKRSVIDMSTLAAF